MYLLYESLYGDLLSECDSTDIIGLYDSREKAVEKAKEIIETDVKENNYVVDVERNNFDDNNNCVIMFWNNQENWDCYYDIIIKKIELK